MDKGFSTRTSRILIANQLYWKVGQNWHSGTQCEHPEAAPGRVGGESKMRHVQQAAHREGGPQLKLARFLLKTCSGTKSTFNPVRAEHVRHDAIWMYVQPGTAPKVGYLRSAIQQRTPSRKQEPEPSLIRAQPGFPITAFFVSLFLTETLSYFRRLEVMLISSFGSK